MDEIGHAGRRNGSGDRDDGFGMVVAWLCHGWGWMEVVDGLAVVPRYILRESVHCKWKLHGMYCRGFDSSMIELCKGGCMCCTC